MNIIAFILAILAAAAFVYDYVKTKGLIALGLALLTVALIVQFVFFEHSISVK